jgi:hypothetical protein
MHLTYRDSRIIRWLTLLLNARPVQEETVTKFLILFLDLMVSP